MVDDREAQALRAAFPGPDDVDEFGVPRTLLGDHPAQVWGAIGRTVAVAAVLENRLVALLQMLTLSGQSAYATETPTGLIAKLRGLEPAGDPAWAGWDTWLDQAADAFEWRNHVVHNLWPAQSGGRLFGWRLGRDGKLSKVESTERELMSKLVELATLTTRAQRWTALAGVEQGRQTGT